MQPSGCAGSLDGDDLVAVIRGSKRKATVHAPAADIWTVQAPH